MVPGDRTEDPAALASLHPSSHRRKFKSLEQHSCLFDRSQNGLVRETPLESFNKDGSWFLVGSNFAQHHHPAWTTNLLVIRIAKS